MKTLLISRISSFVVLFFITISCNTYDKDQISDIEKLSSPNNKYDLYLYTINSGMSFGSNINALKIEKFGTKPNFYNSDFYRISNSQPFQVKWNDDDNLNISTISHVESSKNKQPFKSERQNFKGVNITNNYFTMFSTVGNSEFSFSNYYEKNGNIVFKNENDSLVFNEKNSQFHISKEFIEVIIFESNKYEKNEGLAIDSYRIIPKNNFDFRKLDKFQPLKLIE